MGIGRVDEANVQLPIGPFVKASKHGSNVFADRKAVHHTGILREEVGKGLHPEILFEHIFLGEQEDDRDCDRNDDIFECAQSIPHLVLEIVNSLASLRISLSTYQVVLVLQSTTVLLTALLYI